MSAVNVIAALVILLIVGPALFYIIREKKKGRHCIGCPAAGSCSRAGCGCKGKKEQKGS